MGSRIRLNPDKVFEVFVEIGRSEGDKRDPVILKKYPPDFNQQDVLAEIPKFAFPCKSDISQVEQFVFVLTDLEGMFRFVYCRHGTSANTCLCIMSHLPWFEVFYKMLNFLADIVNCSENSDPTSFLEATFLHDIPMPDVPVTIVAGRHMLNFTVPDPNHLPSIPGSRNLTEYYNAVDASNMMRIFASMLHERRIIITSKKLSRITACVHASEALLYPMHWQHLFIPVLPAHVIDMVTAPMPYLIGVHSSLMETIEEKQMDLGDAVIVDADKNEVRSEHDDLEALPDDVSSYLKRQLKTQKVQTNMMESGDAISRAFLLALVRLIGGYRDALRFHTDQPITFDREAFVQSRTSKSTQTFLENMLQLQIFQQFISGRLELLNAGKGFHDLFEQESIKYADHLNTNSKYKEWLAKKTRKLKITDLKDKAAPVMSTAVQSVNVKRKKVMSKLREQFNESKMSGHKAEGGGVEERVHHHRHTTPITASNLLAYKPPRPPPPSASALSRTMKVPHRSTVYKTVTVGEDEQSGSHDDLHQSSSLVDITIAKDEHLRTLTRSASADDLLFDKHVVMDEDISSSSSEVSSTSFEDLSHLSSADLPSLSYNSFPSASSNSQNTSPTTQGSSTKKVPGLPCKDDHFSDSLITGDRLITARGAQEASAAKTSTPVKGDGFTDRLITGDRLITPGGSRPPSATAPPIPAKRRDGAQSAGDALLSKPTQPHPPPVPKPRSSSFRRERAKDDEPPPPPLPPKVSIQAEKPLINFESFDDEQFDPLLSRKSLPGKGPQGGPDNLRTSSSVAFNLMPNPKSAFMRSATYRKAMEDRPVYPDEAEDGRTKTNAQSKDPLSSFDPFASLPSTASVKAVSSSGKQTSTASSNSPRDTAVKTVVRSNDSLSQFLDLDPLTSTVTATAVDPDTAQVGGMMGAQNQKGAEPSSSDSLLQDWTLEQFTGGNSISQVPARPPPPLSHLTPTTSVSTLSKTSSAAGSAPLQPPPIPRPRPRHSMAVTQPTEVDSTPAGSTPLPQSSALLGPGPSISVLQQVDPWMGRESGAVSLSHPVKGLDDTNSKKSSSAVTTNPKPIQRVSVAALTKQFDHLNVDVSESSSASQSHSRLCQTQPSVTAQWETFD